MDDYPAQVAMMDENVRDTAAPVISSSQLIRCAKILKMVAGALGKDADCDEYNKDIARVSAALNKYSWDEKNQPEDGHDHDINACQYAWLPFKKMIGDMKAISEVIKDAYN
jgi:hypothetical protein